MSYRASYPFVEQLESFIERAISVYSLPCIETGAPSCMTSFPMKGFSNISDKVCMGDYQCIQLELNYGFPWLVFITLISVTSSIFYLKILMNNFIEKNQILILGVYEFLEKLNTNSNVHYTLQHAHCKRKKKQYELVNFCIFSSKYRQILKAVLFLY